MSLLTQRALRVFAVLEDYRSGSADILDALLPFFEPFLVDRAGLVLEPSELAEAVNNAYRWSLTTDIIEELVPRFEDKGWVEQRQATKDAAIYWIVHQPSENKVVGEAVAEVGQVLVKIAEHFQSFIRDISPLTAVARETDQLSEILIEWLVSIDAYTEEVLRQQVIQPIHDEGKMGLVFTLPDDSALTSEDRYLCARYIKHLYDKNSPYIPDLCKIASVGLITEVIQDFRKPTTMVKKTNLNVYLDGPVALDFLGVSGAAAADNIRPIIKQLRSSGAKIRIFRVSVRELQKALKAVLGRPATERTGPTAEAIRRNQVLEAFVRQVAQNPDNALAKQDVQIVERKLEQFPGEDQYFAPKQYESLFARINWHVEVQPREHDASIIAFILRMRHDVSSADLFETRHVLVTRNPLLAKLSRRFCRENDLIGPADVGPAIHQRQLATAVWLRTGLWDEADEVPKRYVLAACERVLELKKSVIDKVRSEGRNLTPEKAEQLEILLTQDRSVQVLMDKTLNTSQLVGPSNIEMLLNTMQQSLVTEIEKDSSRKIDEARRDAEAKVRKAHGGRRQAEKQADEFADTLRERDAEDDRLLRRFVGDVNSQIRRRRKWISRVVAGLVFLFSFLPWAVDAFPNWLKVIVVLAGGLFAWLLAYRQIWDRPTGLARILEQRDHILLQSRAHQRGLEEKLAKFDLTYADHQFALSSPASSELSEERQQGLALEKR